MSFRINTNIGSIQAQTSMTKVSREVQESTSKLSSGQRITKAADDAAGLAISENMKASIRSSKQANRNANDGVSLIQTAEGGLNESSSILTRMRELAIQASTDTLGDSEREKSNGEYQSLKLELERISQTTEFNGRKLLSGKGDRLDFQVGIGDDSSDDHISYNTAEVNAGIDALGVRSASILSKFSAQNDLSQLDGAINKISSHRAILGSLQNRLVSSSNNLSVYTENMSASNSRIRDTDYAVESSTHARNSIVENTSTAVLAQANMSGKVAMKLLD